MDFLSNRLTNKEIQKVNDIDNIKSSILKVVFNSGKEYQLQKLAISNSTYYGILVSSTNKNFRNKFIKSFNFADGTFTDDFNKSIFFNYIRIVEYIHTYFNKSNVSINTQFVSNINTLILRNLSLNENFEQFAFSKNEGLVGREVLVAELSELISFLFYSDKHIILKACVFIANFIIISPFPLFNELTAWAIILLYLYRNGYSVDGIYSPEIFMYHSLNKYDEIRDSFCRSNKSKDDIFDEFINFYINITFSTIENLSNELDIKL